MSSMRISRVTNETGAESFNSTNKEKRCQREEMEKSVTNNKGWKKEI